MKINGMAEYIDEIGCRKIKYENNINTLRSITTVSTKVNEFFLHKWGYTTATIASSHTNTAPMMKYLVFLGARTGLCHHLTTTKIVSV